LKSESVSTSGVRQGPLTGDPKPVHGGSPSADGCGGCTDCCYLPEISVTDEESSTLAALAASRTEPGSTLVFTVDPAHDGWQIMHGPCVFRESSYPLHSGGCQIYEDRPSSCRIFTCTFLLGLRSRPDGGSPVEEIATTMARPATR
jgi:hypothetical protein